MGKSRSERVLSLVALAMMGTDALAGGSGGHDTNDGSAYDIWSHECHNAANRFVIPFRMGSLPMGTFRGIISCTGRQAITEPQGHTYNWEVKMGNPSDEVCLFNWAKKKCWTRPHINVARPNIRTRDAWPKVADFCGPRQYDPGVTIALPAGVRVASAGPVSCVKEAYGIPLDSVLTSRGQSPPFAALPKCLSCCNERINLWRNAPVSNRSASGSPQDGQAFEQTFGTKCRALCSGTFTVADSGQPAGFPNVGFDDEARSKGSGAY